MQSTEEDNFVGRILWALSDSSGVPARRFASLDPAPPLDWLEHLSRRNLLQQSDLVGFGIPNRTQKQQPIVDHLTHWLIDRHLNIPKLLLWLSQQAGGPQDADFIKLRPTFAGQIQNESHFRNLTTAMRILWGLFLAERIKLPNLNVNFYSWKEQFTNNELTVALRFTLRDLLTPQVLLRNPKSWYQDQEALDTSAQIRKLVDWEIVLRTDHLRSELSDLHNNSRWIKALPELLADFTTLLKDAMDLMHELGGASDKSDLSYVHQPSIDEHLQNDKHLYDWTALIELNRDAWLATANIAPEQARRAAEDWCRLPYPIFRRLAFFAATQDGGVIPAELGLSWLLADDRRWLWSVAVKREAMRLLVALVPQLDAQQLAELERAVLAGPLPDLYRNDISEDKRTEVIEHDIWFCLAKITGSGKNLGEQAQKKLNDLCEQHQTWQLRADEGDEFPFFRIDDPNEIFPSRATPRHARQLLDWVKQNPQADHSQPDDWRKRCNNDLCMTAWVLCSLAEAGIWPVNRWCEALGIWSQEKDLTKRSWCYVAPVLVKTPHQKLQLLARYIGWWLGNVAKVIDLNDRFFISLCERLLEFEDQNNTYSDGDLVPQAANHPIGLMTDALLNWWFSEPRYDKQGLTNNIKTIFSKLCDHQSNCFQRFLAGRIVLAEHAIVLFRVDSEWTQKYLLWLFDWERNEAEARGAWQGFLCSPRLYPSFMELTKTFFIDTAKAKYYNQLGHAHGEQYARFLTLIIFNQSDIYTTEELSQAMRALPVEGLKHAATALAQFLEGVDQQNCLQFWRNRVLPYLELWPQENDKLTQEISESFAKVCVAARDAFPEALNRLRLWLKPLALEHNWYLLGKLSENQTTQQFPEDSLEFLFLVTDRDSQPFSVHSYLKTCLQEIKKEKPSLENYDHFKKLRDLLRRAEEELD